MTVEEFTQLLAQECPTSLPSALQALWYAKNQAWDKAHQIVQNDPNRDSAWVHAYLHRQAGDLSNARYWYRRSGQSEYQGDLDQEWEQIAKAILSQT